MKYQPCYLLGYLSCFISVLLDSFREQNENNNKYKQKHGSLTPFGTVTYGWLMFYILILN